MTIDPVGVVSITKERLRTTLANCDTVKDWSKDRKTSIFLDVMPEAPEGREEFTRDEWEQLRPFVLIYTLPITYTLVATPGSYTPRGSMVAVFEQNTPQANHTGEELDRLFDNFIGRVIAEIMTKARSAEDGWVYPSRVTTDGPQRSSVEQSVAIGDCQRYTLEFEWGTGA